MSKISSTQNTKGFILYLYVFIFGHSKKRPKITSIASILENSIIDLFADVVFYIFEDLGVKYNEIKNESIFYLMYLTWATLERD